MRAGIVMRTRFQQPELGKCPGVMAATTLRPKPQRCSETDMMSKSSGSCLDIAPPSVRLRNLQSEVSWFHDAPGLGCDMIRGRDVHQAVMDILFSCKGWTRMMGL